MKLGQLCECGCALALFLGFKSKNNVKYCNPASYKSPKFIYSSILPNIDFLEPGLSSETVEMVSDLFLFAHSSLIPKTIIWDIILHFVNSPSILKNLSFLKQIYPPVAVL